uniref:Endonuclease/exonuclease/phosphatase domain-containing protein n=1 Tax=Magallana gigas TaxID=29159 RepID=A0A8W8MMD5_MAGGI
MPPKKKPNERKKRELERQKKQIKRNNKPDIKCCSVSSFANINPVNHNSTDSRVPEEIITAESTSVDCAETSFQLDDGIGVQVHNEPPPASVQEQYSAVLTAVQEELAKLKPDEKISLDELLQRASMLEDDDADVFMTGILEYYAARPSKLSEMTLAEFASKYKKSSNKTLDKSDEKKIQLQGGFGVMSQREVRTEHNILLLAPKQDPSLRICAVLLYHNPKRTMTVTKFLEDLEVILSHCPQGLPSFLLGDFNIDLSLNTTSAKHLQNLMKYYGFRPCVSEPTHRQGGHLDNIFTNILFTPLLDVIPKYYTDHMFLSLAVPWTQFYQ